MVSVALKPGRRENHEEIDRHENPDGGKAGTEKTSNQIANKSYGDHDRPRSDHRHGHRVEKLAIIEPLVLLDDSPIEKGDDCQAAAEDKSSSLSEKPEHLCQSLGCYRAGQTGS